MSFGERERDRLIREEGLGTDMAALLDLLFQQQLQSYN